MWRSPSIDGSENGQKGMQYPIEKLDFLINYIGHQMFVREELDELWDKDAICDMHSCYFLKKITNGEYLFALYQIFQELTSPEPAKELVAYKEGILTELFLAATEEALERISNDDWQDVKDVAADLWTFHEFIRKRDGEPVWTGDKGKEKKAPQLNRIKSDDWRYIVDGLFEELFWDLDYQIFGHFSTYKEQPHYPTFPEFREAVIWLQEAYENTRVNRRDD